MMLSMAILGILLIAPMDSLGQMVASFIILALINFSAQEAVFSSRFKDFFRILAITLGIAISIRYIVWRGMYTMTAMDWISLVFVWLLYIAEIYALLTSIIGCIVNAFPLNRPELTIADYDESELPTVDVFIPSYNEELQILEITVRAAQQMHYPKHKLFIHLLDDGGTDQKINDPDPVKANNALKRRNELSAFCQRVGIRYHTRAKNEHAKAGNVNRAFANTHAEQVVILDADHVPTSDFLDKTIPWLIRDPDVFLVQTPHFMANPDPVERNYFSAFTRMPSENDMFYGTIQRGLDYWSSSFFCGSAAVMRRSHLEMVNGISGESITEDAETALDLHQFGLKSVYVNRPMVSGLAPETFDAFVSQRMRWAQGMTQILLLKKPYGAKGLSWFQRVGYMSSILFWLFPFARVVFLLMPLAYLVFGLQVYHASLMEILAFTVPHIVATYMLSTLLFGRTRWPLVSELYEILQCVFTLKALINVFRSPRSPSFVVTPKGENLDAEHISPLSNIFYWLIFLVGLAQVVGVFKFIYEPLTRDLTGVVLLWNSFNLLILLGVLSVLIERKQIRVQSRLPAFDDVTLQCEDGRVWVGHLYDLSVGGTRMRIKALNQDLPEHLKLVGWSESAQENIALHSRVLFSNIKTGDVRLMFEPRDDEELNQVISFALCDSRRWKSFQRRRTRPISYWYGVKHVVRVSFTPIFTHARMHLKNFWHNYTQAKE